MTRVGIGYDVHRLVEGRKLILGGVDIPYEKGLLGHSDADVLLHAISDALLGAAALGDALCGRRQRKAPGRDGTARPRGRVFHRQRGLCHRGAGTETAAAYSGDA